MPKWQQASPATADRHPAANRLFAATSRSRQEDARKRIAEKQARNPKNPTCPHPYPPAKPDKKRSHGDSASAGTQTLVELQVGLRCTIIRIKTTQPVIIPAPPFTQRLGKGQNPDRAIACRWGAISTPARSMRCVTASISSRNPPAARGLPAARGSPAARGLPSARGPPAARGPLSDQLSAATPFANPTPGSQLSAATPFANPAPGSQLFGLNTGESPPLSLPLPKYASGS